MNRFLPAATRDRQVSKIVFRKSIQGALRLCLCSGLAVRALAQEAFSPLTLEKTIPMDKVEGRIDHMAADPKGQRLFVAALGNDTVEVLDLKAGKTIRSIPGFAEPQGIAYAAEFGRLFIANGEDGLCRILDAESLTPLGAVPCGDDADNVRYDEQAKRIYVGYGSGALAVLDAKSGAKLADIKLAAHPESFRLETGGVRIFVNVPRAEQLAVVDRERAKVIATWPLKEARSNFPLFLDEASHRLFVGCRSPAKLLIYDTSAPGGRVVASLGIVGDTDDLFFDAQNKLVYVSGGEGTITVIRQVNPDSYELVKTIPTAPGARTSLLVPELKELCLAVPRRGSQRAEIRVFKTR